MSINWWVGKQTYCVLYHRVLLNQKEWTSDTHNNMDESRERYAKWKKSDTKHYQYDSIHDIFKRQSYNDREQITDCPGPGVGTGDWLQRVQGNLWGDGNVLSLNGGLYRVWWLHDGTQLSTHQIVHLKQVNFIVYKFYLMNVIKQARMVKKAQNLRPEKPRFFTTTGGGISGNQLTCLESHL